MSKHVYVAATTGRFTKWYFAHYLEHQYKPSLEKILHWLRHKEDYATPLRVLECLCDDLRKDDKCTHEHIVQWITSRLISALREERQFGDKAKEFFGAMVDRCGIDDHKVKLYDKTTGKRVGTLHDLQLRNPEEVSDEDVQGL